MGSIVAARSWKLFVLAGAVLLLSGNLVTASAAVPQANITRTLSSGLVTVNGNKEKVRLCAANASGKARTVTLTLLNEQGKPVATTTEMIPLDHSLCMTNDPTITGRIRGVVTMADVPSGTEMLATLEIDALRSDGLHALVSIDSFEPSES